MANRVLIGTRNSQEGIYVSRSGKNVLTCSDDELLFRMDDGASGTIKGLYQLQPISGTSPTATASVSAGATATVSISNFSWTNGVVPYAMGSIGSGSAGGDISETMGFTFGTISTSSLQITSTLSSGTLNVTLAASPVMFSGALF
jgi:hypothetical protein